MRMRLWALCCLLPLVGGLMSGCVGGKQLPAYTVPSGGDAYTGRQIMVQHRCGQCHHIPGIHDANGVFGPPLIHFGDRTTIAGNFPNDPDYLVRWIMSPKSLKPRTAMPDLGLSQQDARDVAAYLYTLR